MPSKPLMRSLGEFFGHVWSGIKADPGSRPEGTRPRVVRREVQEKTIETPQGPVTLRRTTVDEIEPPRA